MKTAQLTMIAACLALLGGVAAPAQAAPSTADGLQLSADLNTSAFLLAASGSDRKNDGLDDGPDAPEVDGPDDNGVDALPHARLGGGALLAASGSDRKNDGLDDGPDTPDVDGPDDNGVDALPHARLGGGALLAAAAVRF